MKGDPLVSIIIVNWNGGEMFRKCLESLGKMNYPKWELIVVDNGSVDGSEGLPLQYKTTSNYKLIKNKTNLGFAEGNNQGYQIAKGEYILLLNNDTLVDRYFLDLLVKRLEKDRQVGVVQPKIQIMDNPKLLDNVGSFLTKTGFLQHVGYMQEDSTEFNRELEVFSAKGACLLIKREVIEKVGLFDKDFGSYFEESDFCWRVWLAGYKVIYYPQAVIQHKVGMTVRKMNQILVNYHSAKNRICSMLKNLGSNNLLILLGMHIFFVMGLATYYLVRLQLSKSWMMYKAIGWNIFHLSSTLRKRSKVQKIRIKNDKEIFPIIMRRVSLMEMFTHFRRVEANFNG